MNVSAKAAFFRVEGALIRPAAVPAPAFLTANAKGAAGAPLARLGGAALAAGLRLAAPLRDQPATHRLAWMGLRGADAERLTGLSAEYYARHLLPGLKPAARALLDEARRLGFRIVLLSDDLDLVVAPLQALLGADELLANRMEILDGRATGRLLDPLIGAAPSGQWLRGLAAERGLDLARSRAYAALHADALLLSAVGHPCAVDPDWRLRRLAMDQDWPIVHT